MKKILIDIYAALLNLGKALHTPSKAQLEANQAKQEVKQAKERISETIQKQILEEKKKHYDSLVTLNDYGYSRFIIFCDNQALSAHVTFEYAMRTFLDLMHLNKAPQVGFEDENGRIEDFTEYFIL